MISLSPWLLVAIALAVIALGVVSAFAITRASLPLSPSTTPGL